MKICQVCGLNEEASSDSCGACGEGSWSFSVSAYAEPERKQGKKRPIPDVKPAETTVAISDAEFAAELVTASATDLLSLIGDESLPQNWRALVEAEIANRDSQLAKQL